MELSLHVYIRSLISHQHSLGCWGVFDTQDLVSEHIQFDADVVYLVRYLAVRKVSIYTFQVEDDWARHNMDAHILIEAPC